MVRRVYANLHNKSFIMDRLLIRFDYDTIRELWNGIYYENSSVTINNETYTRVEKINTSEFSDGESWDYIVQRKSDNKYFNFNVWHTFHGHVFSDENTLTEVFPQTIVKTIYK